MSDAGGRIRLSVTAPSCPPLWSNLRQLPGPNTHCEVRDLVALAHYARSHGIVVYEAGDGGNVTKLLGWHQHVAGIRRTDVPGLLAWCDHDGNHTLTVNDVSARVDSSWDHATDIVADTTATDLLAAADAGGIGRRSLYPHQDAAVSRYQATRQGLVCAMAPGAGKTPTAVVALAERFAARHGHGHAVVVAPSAVIDQWITEFERHWPELGTFTDNNVKQASTEHGGVVELVPRDRVAAHSNALGGRHVDDLVIDEAAFLRGTSRAARGCASIRSYADRCLLLTGTPQTRRTADLAALCSFARNETWGGQKFERTVAGDRHLLEPAFCFGVAPTPRDVTFQLHDVSVDDATEQATQTLRTVHTDHVDAERTTWNTGTTVRDGPSIRANRGARLLALQNAARALTRAWTHASLSTVGDLVDTLDGPTLVFCHDPGARTTLATRFEAGGRRVATVNTAADASMASAGFVDSSIDIAVVGKAGDLGVNFTACRHLVVADTPFDPSLFRQRVGRGARIGHDGTQLDVHLFAVGDDGRRVCRALTDLWGQAPHDNETLSLVARIANR